VASSYIKFRSDSELDAALQLKIDQLETDGVHMSKSMLARLMLRSALTTDQTLRKHTDRAGLAPVAFPDLGLIAEIASSVRQAAQRAIHRLAANLPSELQEELAKLES
jgi:hypothetical protein